MSELISSFFVLYMSTFAVYCLYHIMLNYNVRGLVIFMLLYYIGIRIAGIAAAASVFVVHVAVLPIVFRYSKSFRNMIVFGNAIQYPPYTDFANPSKSGLVGARHLSIQFHSKIDNCNIEIGMWHILPKSSYEKLREHFKNNTEKKELNKLFDEELANTTRPVILHFHGKGNARAAPHRIAIYKFFQDMDYHTITFDYRGYGDSTKQNVNPSEVGVVEDSLNVYSWLLSTLKKTNDVFIWGHSMGTAVSSHLMGNLQDLSTRLLDRDKPLPLPKGMILEAAFNNLADAVSKHPLAKIFFTWLPYFDAMFVSPFRSDEEISTFKSDEYLAKVNNLDILMIHAKDDAIVPFVLGERLYDSLAKTRTEEDGYLKFQIYENKDKLGHRWMCTSKDFPHIVSEFINPRCSSQEMQEKCPAENTAVSTSS